MIRLNQQQLNFFDTFGYLALPGLMADCIDEIIDAFKRLARTEGIFCEPASAASVAGLIKTAAGGVDLRGATIVCVLTGTGLKDPAFAIRTAGVEAEQSDADLEAVASLLRLPRVGAGA